MSAPNWGVATALVWGVGEPAPLTSAAVTGGSSSEALFRASLGICVTTTTITIIAATTAQKIFTPEKIATSAGSS